MQEQANDFEPYSAQLTIDSKHDSDTGFRRQRDAVEAMYKFLANAKGAVLISYTGCWDDYHIGDHIPDEQMTEEDGMEGQWAFSDESLNIYEFLELIDKVLAVNPALFITVTTDAPPDEFYIWSQSLLRRRATAKQLARVRIV